MERLHESWNIPPPSPLSSPLLSHPPPTSSPPPPLLFPSSSPPPPHLLPSSSPPPPLLLPTSSPPPHHLPPDSWTHYPEWNLSLCYSTVEVPPTGVFRMRSRAIPRTPATRPRGSSCRGRNISSSSTKIHPQNIFGCGRFLRSSIARSTKIRKIDVHT